LAVYKIEGEESEYIVVIVAQLILVAHNWVKVRWRVNLYIKHMWV